MEMVTFDALCIPQYHYLSGIVIESLDLDGTLVSTARARADHAAMKLLMKVRVKLDSEGVAWYSSGYSRFDGQEQRSILAPPLPCPQWRVCRGKGYQFGPLGPRDKGDQKLAMRGYALKRLAAEVLQNKAQSFAQVKNVRVLGVCLRRQGGGAERQNA